MSEMQKENEVKPGDTMLWFEFGKGHTSSARLKKHEVKIVRVNKIRSVVELVADGSFKLVYNENLEKPSANKTKISEN